MEKLIRYTLSILLLLLGLNALGGGYYGMSGAKDIPIEWLNGSPFKNYFIPGLFLFVIIGGLSILSSIAVLLKHRHAKKASIVCALIVLIWIAIQVSIIGIVSWMQPITTIAALLILLLTLLLNNYDS